MSVPADPGSGLGLVKANLPFGLLEQVFDAPAHAGHADQFIQWGRLGAWVR
jgi:hypothetical protein